MSAVSLDLKATAALLTLLIVLANSAGELDAQVVWPLGPPRSVSNGDISIACGGEPTVTAQINTAITALSANGGGNLRLSGECAITQEGGIGIVLQNNVHIIGPASLSINGAWSDSVVSALGRDDNNPNTFVFQAGMLNLTLTSNASLPVILDITGFRNSSFENLFVNNNGMGSPNEISLRVSDSNLTGTSSKSTFFNNFTNLSVNGITCISLDTRYGNASVNTFKNTQLYCVDNAIGVPSSVQQGDNFDTMYVFSPGGKMFPNGAPGNSTFVQVSCEGCIDNPISTTLSTTQVIAGGPQSYLGAGYTVPKAAQVDIWGQSPVMGSDMGTNPFVISPGNLSISGDTTQVFLVSTGATAYWATYRLDLIGVGFTIVSPVHNTGEVHAEYLKVNNNYNANPMARVSMSLTQPIAGELLLATVSVSAGGMITELVDNQQNVQGPNMTIRSPILTGLATSCSGQVSGTVWNNSGMLGVCP